MRACVLLFIGPWLLGPKATAQPLVSVGPAPAWVEPLVPDLSAPSSEVDVSEGIHHLLLDVQVNAVGRPIAEYDHRAWRVLGETGVQNGSTLRIPFDPSFQRLVLHEIVVHRNGERLQRLDADRLRLIQREERLDAQIYDGTLTALYFVEGVHDGDVVEHSYTLSGLNPSFEDRWAEQVDLRWSVPLVEHRHRLLWPAGRELRLRGHGTDLEPTVERRGAVVEYLWHQSNVEPQILEADVPDWYDAWPWIQLSEWSSWSEVAEWGRRLFEPAESLPPVLKERAAAWRAEDPGEAELARRALRLVQDEVRYLGIEFGPNAYQPSEPRTVYERRFGDCKDKSVLLVQLLHELGLDASPALIDTVAGRTLPTLLPTPLAFDHAVVRLKLGEEDYWLDATRLHERGAVARRSVPEWGWALVLEPDARGLTPVRARDFSLTRIEETYEVPDYESPVLFTVRTRYEGSDADETRAQLASNSREEIQLAYRDYYANLWARVESVRPVEISDDELANVLVTTETYRIPDFWTDSADGRRKVAEVSSLLLDDELLVPATVMRERPVAIRHPRRIEQRTELRLPEPWRLDARDRRVRDPAFRFDYEARAYEDGRVVLLHRYETLRDWVEPERAASYRDHVEQARETLWFNLTNESARREASARDLEWPLLLLALVALGAGLVAALVAHRSRPGSEAPELARPLAGWLVPLSLLVLALPLFGLVRMEEQHRALERSEWRSLTSPADGNPFDEAEVLLGLLGGAALTGLGLFAALQWLGRRRGAPNALSACLGVWYLLQLVDAGLQVARSRELGEALECTGRLLVEGLLVGVVLAYLAISGRVQSTFLR